MKMKRYILTAFLLTSFLWGYGAGNYDTDKPSRKEARKSFYENKGANTWGLYAGINCTLEYGARVTPTVGFSYEWVPKWTGIETGAYYTYYISPFKVHFTFHMIEIPIMWKFHTRHVNIALGIQTQWWVGYDVNLSKSDPSIFYEGGTFYGYAPAVVDAGLKLKVGFPVKINDRWSMEPTIGMQYLVENSFAANVGVVFRINAKNR